jgi:hypothetical protein
MSCSNDGEILELKAKRSFDESPVSFDWHDFLANVPQRGKAYALNDRVRLKRADSKGFQYRCSTAGVTGSVEPRWPKVLAGTVTDGSVVWTAEAVDAVSLRTTISSDTFVADSGVTLGAESNADLVYYVLVSGGTDGQSYLIKHQIGCANGEDKEALGRLPVED